MGSFMTKERRAGDKVKQSELQVSLSLAERAVFAAHVPLRIFVLLCCKLDILFGAFIHRKISKYSQE